MPLNPEQRRAVPFPGASYYSFVPYVPQALGIAAGAMVTAGRRSAATDGQMAHGAVARSRYRTASHHPLETRKLLKLEAYRPNRCVARWHASCLVAAVC